uniref:Uncharacterized protein n=1 Tax=Caldiarchaeum subterraneum TaxID=311458 RepID=A0A7C4E1J7_CALS0
MNKALYLILIALLAVPSQGQSIEPYWLVGFDGDMMLPFLDRGVLECGVGENVAVKIVGRDGFVTLVSPNGVIENVFVRDGERTVLRRFGPGDAGNWTIVADTGQTLTIQVKPPATRPPIQVSVRFEGLFVVLTISTPPNTYALFLEGRGDGEVAAAGSSIEFGLQGFNETRVRVEILRREPPIRYAGLLDGLPYTMQLDPLSVNTIVEGKRINDSMVFSVKLPSNGEQVSGWRKMGLGYHLIRLYTVSDKRLILEREIVVVPEWMKSYVALSRSVREDVWTAANKTFTMLVGDEAGNVWVLHIRPPIAFIRLYDQIHSRYVKNVGVALAGGQAQNLDDWTGLIFANRIEISNYSNNSSYNPSTETNVLLNFNATSLSLPLAVTAGDMVTLNLQLHEAHITLVWPNGTTYRGPSSVIINSAKFTNTSSLLLPVDKYVVRAEKPPSFSSKVFTLTADTTWTIIVLDDPAGVAGFRVSAVLLTALLLYTVFRMRKTFYQAGLFRRERR